MNQVIEVSLDDGGHIIVPSSLQSMLGLSPGMTLLVEQVDNGECRLRATSQSSVIVKKKGVKIAKAEPLTDLTNITRFEREYRVAELLQRVGFS